MKLEKGLVQSSLNSCVLPKVVDLGSAHFHLLSLPEKAMFPLEMELCRLFYPRCLAYLIISVLWMVLLWARSRTVSEPRTKRKN